MMIDTEYSKLSIWNNSWRCILNFWPQIKTLEGSFTYVYHRTWAVWNLMSHITMSSLWASLRTKSTLNACRWQKILTCFLAHLYLFKLFGADFGCNMAFWIWTSLLVWIWRWATKHQMLRVAPRKFSKSIHALMLKTIVANWAWAKSKPMHIRESCTSDMNPLTAIPGMIAPEYCRWHCPSPIVTTQSTILSLWMLWKTSEIICFVLKFNIFHVNGLIWDVLLPSPASLLVPKYVPEALSS